jgi:hypothetical protein
MKNSKRMSRGYLLRAAVEGIHYRGRRRPRHITRLFGAQCLEQLYFDGNSGKGNSGKMVA